MLHLKQGTDDYGRSEGAFTMLKGSTEPGVWRSGVWRMEEEVRSLVGWQEEQRTVQQGFCPAVSLCGVHLAFGDHGMAWCSWIWGEECAEWETCTAPGEGQPVLGGQQREGSHCFHALVCSCTSPWPHQPEPHCCCPAAQHSVISLGARSRCADALFPAPNSQPPALTTAFLGQLREGQSIQDCLTCSVNVTLPWALLPAGSWPWMHHH